MQMSSYTYVLKIKIKIVNTFRYPPQRSIGLHTQYGSRRHFIVYVVWVLKMGNIAPRARIEPTCLAFRVNSLAIPPPGPLRGPLPERNPHL